MLFFIFSVPPIKRNSVAPENPNFPGKNHHKWNKTSAKGKMHIIVLKGYYTPSQKLACFCALSQNN